MLAAIPYFPFEIMSKFYEAIVAGAGPVGLMIAGDLGAPGVSVLVLERDEDLKSPWKSLPLGMRALNTPSVEAFYRRGLLEKLTRLRPIRG